MTASPEDLLERAGFADHVAVRQAAALDEVFGPAAGVAYELTIKANPPVYQGAVAGLAQLLQQAFEVDSSPLVVAAGDDLADIASRSNVSAAEKLKLADARVAALQAELAAVGQELGDDLAEGVGRYLATTYRLGQSEVAKPLGQAVSFTLVDRDALAGLQRNGLFWIGNHYGEALEATGYQDAIRSIMLEQGLGRTAAGARLQEILGGQIRRSESYWRGFAATTATRSRSFGALSSLESVGATTYEYINPDDVRTSDVCRELDGTVFTVKGGIALRDELLASQDPEEWKQIAAWPSHADLLDASGKVHPPAVLQRMGIAWPPLHFHCRSSIQVRIMAAKLAGRQYGRLRLASRRAA